MPNRIDTARVSTLTKTVERMLRRVHSMKPPTTAERIAELSVLASAATTLADAAIALQEEGIAEMKFGTKRLM